MAPLNPILVLLVQQLIQTGRTHIYAASITKPREAVTTGKTITKQIEGEFKVADALLVSGLDEFILSFRSTVLTFYEDYRNARAVVNRAATRTRCNRTPLRCRRPRRRKGWGR